MAFGSWLAGALYDHFGLRAGLRRRRVLQPGQPRGDRPTGAARPADDAADAGGGVSGRTAGSHFRAPLQQEWTSHFRSIDRKTPDGPLSARWGGEGQGEVGTCVPTPKPKAKPATAGRPPFPGGNRHGGGFPHPTLTRSAPAGRRGKPHASSGHDEKNRSVPRGGGARVAAEAFAGVHRDVAPRPLLAAVRVQPIDRGPVILGQPRHCSRRWSVQLSIDHTSTQPSGCATSSYTCQNTAPARPRTCCTAAIISGIPRVRRFHPIIRHLHDLPASRRSSGTNSGAGASAARGGSAGSRARKWHARSPRR